MVVGVVATIPVERMLFIFAIVVLFVPNEERSARIELTWVLVRPEDTIDVAVPPLRTVCTFAIVALLALNEESRSRIEETCALERPEDAVVVVVGVDPSQALPFAELKPEYEEHPGR